MIRIEDFIQLKAFARQDGLLLSLLWTASFALIVYMPASAMGNILAIITPLFVAWRLRIFREYALGGIISMRRAYGYSAYTFVYASLVFAIVQYLYFKFLDHGTFMQMIDSSLTAITAIYRQAGVSTAELTATADSMRTLTPINWAFIFMMQNVCIGAMLSLPIAAVMARRMPRSGGAHGGRQT